MGEVDEGVVFVFVDASGGVENVVAEVFPEEDEDGGGNEEGEGAELELAGLLVGDGAACTDGGDRDAVHGWLESGKP